MASPTLVGTRATLRAARASDAAARRRWGWHREIERNYGYERDSGPMSEQEAQDWLDGVRAREGSTFWVVETGADLAGVAFLHAVNTQDRRARFAIGMFDPRFLGRGLGAEATELVLAHAFDGLGLHRVDLRVLDFNAAAIRSYERAGFVVEGRERETCRLGDRWHDDVVMAVLEHEFRAARERRKPPH